MTGRTTKEEQPTAARAETGVPKHQIGASEVQKGRGTGLLRYTDHINPAAQEVQRELQ